MSLKAGDLFPSGVKFKYIPYRVELEGMTCMYIPHIYTTTKSQR